MTTSIQCPPGTRRVGMKCIPLEGEPSGRSQREYYRQYQQDLPAYQVKGQGTYTGMGTGAFHPHYGVTGKSQSPGVLSTPLQTDPSNLNLTGVPGYAGKTPFRGIPGRAGGYSGYDSADVMSGYRVRETPKRIDAPFSMGDPYSQGGSMWNVGRLMGDRSDLYAGIPPTQLYDLRRATAGGAEIPPGYTAGPGRTTPSEGWMSVRDLLGGGTPLAGGIGGGAPVAVGTPSPARGGGLMSIGDLLGGGAPVGSGGTPLAGGIGGGAPSRGSKGSTSRTKKARGGFVGGISKGSTGAAP